MLPVFMDRNRLAIATHSKAFEQTYHTLHPTDTQN